jgi:glycerol-3-phosphate acyltransferase PlsY
VLVIKIVVCLLIGYAFGNFSTAWLCGKICNVDLRKQGSGNLGTTNVMRVLGKKWGIITYLGDFLKVALPVIAVKYIIFRNEDIDALLGLYTGFGAVMGHCYPAWLHFKGGKGIASMSAAMAAYDPWVIPVGVPIFAIVVATTKYVSLGSLTVAILFPIWVTIRAHIMNDNPYFVHMLIVSLLYTISAFYMHRSNIKRLLNGTENKVGSKKK